MRGIKIGLALLALCSGVPVTAKVYVAELSGRLTETYSTIFSDPLQQSTIRVGDIVSATFVYTLGDDAAEPTGTSVEMLGLNQATFRIDDYVWTSQGDFLGELAPPTIIHGQNLLQSYFSTMDDAPGAGDLQIAGYSIDLGEFGYGLYQGPGFKGSFDPNSLKWRDEASHVSAVPEPAAWAFLISGFAAMGVWLRGRRSRQARFGLPA